jgi:hypothetical protein
MAGNALPYVKSSSVPREAGINRNAPNIPIVGLAGGLFLLANGHIHKKYTKTQNLHGSLQRQVFEMDRELFLSRFSVGDEFPNIHDS